MPSPPPRLATRRAAALALVLIPLAAALLPYVLAPYTSALVVLVIAATELAPLTALAAVGGGLLARRLARAERPAARRALTAASVAAIALAAWPGLAAAVVARRAVRAVDALPRAADGVARAAAGDPARRSAWRPADVLRGAPRAAGVAMRSLPTRAADGSPLALRLYRDTASGMDGRMDGLRGGAPRPVVVVLYAGAWRNGDAAQAEVTNRHLAGLGYLVLAGDYRHAPRHQYPSQVDDVRAALALLRDSAAAWRADTARVALWGRSSGAHLAMLAAWGAGAETPPVRVGAVVGFYGPFDLAEGYAILPRPDPLDVRAVLRAFLGGAPDAMPARYRDASPSSRVRGGLPPSLLVYAGRDHMVLPRFGREAAAALRAAGSPVVYLELPWAEHGFDLAPLGADGAAALFVAERFLARVL